MRAIDRLCLVEYVPETAEGKHSFGELIGALSTAFQDIGIRIDYRVNDLDPLLPNLVFGYHRLIREAVSKERAQARRRSRPGKRYPFAAIAHRFSAWRGAKSAENAGTPSWLLPDNCIVFNLEPLNRPAPWLDAYRRFLADSRLVVDYSTVNLELISRAGDPTAHRFRYGYIPLSPFRLPAGNDRLAFFGFVSGRRRKILRRLESAGVGVDVHRNIWGTQRDLLMASAGTTLNLSKHDNSILEVYRLWLSLCLGIPVISEHGTDPELSREWSDYVCLVDADTDLADWRRLPVPDASEFRSGTPFREHSERLADWVEANM